MSTDGATGSESGTEASDGDDEVQVPPERTEPSFAAVEAELESLPDGVLSRARVVGVEQVPASAVPAEFPDVSETGEVCRLSLAGDDQTGETYLPWPEDGGGRLGRLLSLHAVTTPADLQDEFLLLRATDGHWLPAVPDEPLRGDGRAVYGILAGLAPSGTVALFSFFGAGTLATSTSFLFLWLVGTFAVLPVSLYVDAWHLRTTTDWNGRPVVWALLSGVPLVSLLVAPYYLVVRQNARPLA